MQIVDVVAYVMFSYSYQTLKLNSIVLQYCRPICDDAHQLILWDGIMWQTDRTDSRPRCQSRFCRTPRPQNTAGKSWESRPTESLLRRGKLCNPEHTYKYDTIRQ